MQFSLNMDFTIHKFQELCKAITDNYRTITMADYLNNLHPTNFVIMRHDVDRMPGHALEIAKIEYDLGIRSTYYFRSTKEAFKPEIICKIIDLNHEVGYHYETLSEANGDPQKAIELFKSHLNTFRDFCNIQTICMHGRPLSKYDNRDLWKNYDFRNFGITGEAYLSVGNELNYFSDTGRCWDDINSIRDYLPNREKNFAIKSTDDLIELIKNKELDNLYILSHPERWSINFLDWTFYYLIDIVVNLGKKLLVIFR